MRYLVALLLVVVPAASWCVEEAPGSTPTEVVNLAGSATVVYTYGFVDPTRYHNTIYLWYLYRGNGATPNTLTESTPGDPTTLVGKSQIAYQGSLPFTAPYTIQLTGTFSVPFSGWYHVRYAGHGYTSDPWVVYDRCFWITATAQGLEIYDQDAEEFPTGPGTAGDYSGRTAAQQDAADEANQSWFEGLFTASEASKTGLQAALADLRDAGPWGSAATIKQQLSTNPGWGAEPWLNVQGLQWWVHPLTGGAPVSVSVSHPGLLMADNSFGGSSSGAGDGASPWVNADSTGDMLTAWRTIVGWAAWAAFGMSFLLWLKGKVVT